MFANNNMLFVMLNGKADALGDLSATNTSNTTFAGAGMAVGFAAAAAVAKGTSAAAPYTDATTAWLAAGPLVLLFGFVIGVPAFLGFVHAIGSWVSGPEAADNYFMSVAATRERRGGTPTAAAI